MKKKKDKKDKKKKKMALEFWTAFSDGATPVTNGGGLCTTVWGTAVTTYDVVNTPVKSGTSYSLKAAPTASVRGCVGWVRSSRNTDSARFYVYISSAPASGLGDIAHWAPAAGSYICLAVDPSDSKFKIINFNTQTVLGTGPTYSTGVWYQVDMKMDYSANPHVVYCKIDGGTEFSGSIAQTASTTISFRLGNAGTSGPAYTAYYSTLALAPGADYPIGDGSIEAIRPGSDGTHNAGTNVIEDQAGTDIGTAAAWSLLDDSPMNSTTDYVRQVAVGTGNYAEINFQDPANTTNIQGVKALLAYMSSGTQANQGGCIVSHDSFSSFTEVYGNPTTRADYSESSLFYKYANITAPGGGWDSTSLNALKARMGYSNDVTPNPQWHSMVIEIARSSAAPPTAVGPLIGGKLVNHSTLQGRLTR